MIREEGPDRPLEHSRQILSTGKDADFSSHCAPGCSRPSPACVGSDVSAQFGPFGYLYLPYSASQPAGGEIWQCGIRATAGSNDQTWRVLGAIQVLVNGDCRLHACIHFSDTF